MKRMLAQGMPTSGDVNSSAPFSFGASSAVGADYGSKPSVNALRNPTLHNSVPESMVNSTASVPLFVRPFVEGFEKGYSEGDILFVERNTKSRDCRHNTVANLPVINHLLRTSLRPSKNNDGTDELKYQKLEEVLANFNYFGILNTDMDSGSKWQRLLNINVRGRSRVARLWKPENGYLTKGTVLYLGIYKVDPTGVSLTSMKPNGQRQIVTGTQHYFQVRATLECCREDKQNMGNVFRKAKHLIPIGIVSQVTLKRPNTQAILDGHVNTESCKSLERIEVLMRI
jgi:hypothetical protein